MFVFFFFQAEDGIRDYKVTGVQTCALPILPGTLGTGGSVPAPGANDRGPGVLRAGPPPYTAGPGAAVSRATVRGVAGLTSRRGYWRRPEPARSIKGDHDRASRQAHQRAPRHHQ